MPEQAEKRSLLVFRVYVLIIYALAIGLGTGWIAFDFAQNVLNFHLGNLFNESGNFLDIIGAITVGYFIFALIMAGLAAIVSIGTRDAFEVAALFLMGMLPKERKYWGVVFDQTTKKPVAFVPIRVYRYSEGKGTIVSETLTDSDGRYRLHVNDKGGEKYTIEIHYPGYQPVMNYIDEYLVIGNYELVSDIPLLKELTPLTKLRASFYYQKPKFFNWLFYGIYIIYLLIFAGMVVLTINDPIFGNLLAVTVFGYTAIWNTRIIRARRQPLIGKVVDVESHTPILKAFVNVYDPDGNAITALTDKDGIVKLSIMSGVYRSLVTAQGYIMMGRDSQGFKVLKVGKDGYIDKDVLMKKHNAPVVGTPPVSIPAVVVVPQPTTVPAVPAPAPIPTVQPVTPPQPSAPTLNVRPAAATLAPTTPASAPTVVPVTPPTQNPATPDSNMMSPFN